MITLDAGIVFDFPDTWEHFTEGNRCVFHTPRREEIIVTANRATGGGSAQEHSRVVELAFANSLEAARRGASHPDLRTTKRLAEETGACAFRCATVITETIARDALFGQAVIQHPQGIVFLTYEAPFVDGAELTFSDLLKRIHKS